MAFLTGFARSVAAAAALLAAGAALAGPPDPAELLERSEAALGRDVRPHVLIGSDGERLPLSSFRGKPLVVSLVYSSCASVCPTTTQHLLQSVETARRTLGAETFEVLTVGFDARRDTPGRMAAFARDQNIDMAGWRAASGSPEVIEPLLDDLGFSYRAAAGGFEHITQTTILDAEGRVYRHVYGDAFPITVFLEPLKDLVFGRQVRSASFADLVDRIRFICTVYNPSSRAYEFDYAIAFGISIGGFSLLATGGIIFMLWRNNRRLVARRRQRSALGGRA